MSSKLPKNRSELPPKRSAPPDFPLHDESKGESYDFTLQAVMSLKEAVGRLIEAVDTLKTEGREQRGELTELAKDAHAARIILRFIGAGIFAGVGMIGWLIKLFIDYHHH